MVLPGAPDADVQTIAVLPEARRTGLGRALMGQMIAEARRRGVREVFLEVRADNPGAQRLYQSLSFEGIAVRPRYYMPDGVDAVVMRLQVPPTTTELAGATTETSESELLP
jgi:ribosomal-protein-alanine N-acetyltransferase